MVDARPPAANRPIDRPAGRLAGWLAQAVDDCPPPFHCNDEMASATESPSQQKPLHVSCLAQPPALAGRPANQAAPRCADSCARSAGRRAAVCAAWRGPRCEPLRPESPRAAPGSTARRGSDGVSGSSTSGSCPDLSPTTLAPGGPRRGGRAAMRQVVGMRTVTRGASAGPGQVRFASRSALYASRPLGGAGGGRSSRRARAGAGASRVPPPPPPPPWGRGPLQSPKRRLHGHFGRSYRLPGSGSCHRATRHPAKGAHARRPSTRLSRSCPRRLRILECTPAIPSHCVLGRSARGPGPVGDRASLRAAFSFKHLVHTLMSPNGRAGVAGAL
jgi:hypothetical protein